MSAATISMTDDGESFADALVKFHLWPLNLLETNTHPHELQTSASRLRDHEQKLCSSRKTEVDLSDCIAPATANGCYAFNHRTISDLQALEKYCNYGTPKPPPKPKTRFVFLRAKNSRDKLYITLPMLKMLLTYHQVTSGIVDTFLSHGYTTNDLNSCACGFRGEVRVSPRDKGLVIDDIGRSGRNFQVCYTLRAMERNDSQWKLRQTSSYHSFDVSSGNAFWLILKADTTMRDRIRAMADGPFSRQAAAFDTPAHCLRSAIALHLVMCDWAGENWRAYVGELEHTVHELTHKAIHYDIRAPKVPVSRTQTMNTATGSTPSSPSSTRKFTFARVRTLTSMFSRRDTDFAQSPVNLQAIQPSGNRADGDDNEEGDTDESASQLADVFSFNDMQDIQAIEEQANSALLVLRTNADTLGQLKEFYMTLDRFDGWPHDLNEQCKGQIAHFASRINNIECNLRLQQARLETLTRLLADRKALLFAVFEYQNTLVNQELATRAQESQHQMESMTKYMSYLAEKTQQETVSMKIITLVTLFFLPGTFISTLMSTDIIQFGSADDTPPTRELFSGKALALFAKITVPLMAVTFIAWYIMYWWVNKTPRSMDPDPEAGTAKGGR